MSIELNNDQIYAIYGLENWWHSATSKQTFEITGGAGCGKCQPLDTMIPTPCGDILLGDLKVGDYVFDRFGNPTKVLGVYDKGKKQAYEIILEDGRKTICSLNHLWSCYVNDSEELKDFTTEELIEGMVDKDFYLPINDRVLYNNKIFDIDPFNVAISEIKYNTGIPKEYFNSDFNQRLGILSTLLIDKHINYIPNNDVPYIFASIYRYKIMNIKKLLNSLGIFCYIRNINCKYYLFIDIYKHRTKIISVRKLNYETDMRCIYVDSKDHLYLTNDFIVTHNTTVVRYLIERLDLDLDEVLFVTYMGKASMILSRTGLPSKTIHSAFYEYVERPVKDQDGKFIRLENGKLKLKGTFELRDHLPKKIKLIVIDEASMVPENMAHDILSFGLPIIVLGDLNQLPPVFGNSFFLKNPDVTLTKIMRQAEGDPIVWLAQEVLAYHELKYGVYGNSSVIRKSDLTEFHFRTADMIGTGTNRLRYNINNYCREEIKGIKNLDYPHLGEKVICKKNNWGKCIGDGIYMVNGMTGFVDNVYRDSFNGKTMKIDFKPDFTKKVFKNIVFDYKHMYSVPGHNEEDNKFNYFYDKFEFSYANTIHSLQGSQYPFMLYLHEDFMRNKEDNKRLMYTAITRAMKSVTIVI